MNSPFRRMTRANDSFVEWVIRRLNERVNWSYVEWVIRHRVIRRMSHATKEGSFVEWVLRLIRRMRSFGTGGSCVDSPSTKKSFGRMTHSSTVKEIERVCFITNDAGYAPYAMSFSAECVVTLVLSLRVGVPSCLTYSAPIATYTLAWRHATH